MRFNLAELSGSMGDLGTFLPLVAGMAFVCEMDLGVILILAGIANITVGIVFGMPVPVQPMKAIAAVAVAESLLPDQIAAAGLIVGAVMLALGATRIVQYVEKVIPLPVVRGIQLGVGLKLMLQAVRLVAETSWIGLDSVAVGLGAACLIVFVNRWKRSPGALVLFAAGVVVALLETPALTRSLSIGAPEFVFILPSARSWFDGFVHGAVPQLPLTVLNSVIAVCALSGDLFPGRRIPAPTMASSVGLMNLLTCWFGAVPMCHGSGGLAGQYYFGARSGGSMVMLGIINLTVGLVLGAAAAAIIHAYPRSFLGVMLFFAGFELAKPARDQRGGREISITIVTAALIVGINTLVGFATGMALAAVLSLRRTR
ncbi:MAG: putative sulfate/molybdate transporter [Candidatus Latescibacterota bacterium]|nr:MAG: putative sulfate/molybdate transporter [Candidatus Latescibacterota bacterium]